MCTFCVNTTNSLLIKVNIFWEDHKNMTKSPSRFVLYFSEYINFNRQTISIVDTKVAHYYSAWQEFWKVTAISNVCRDVKWRLYALIIILTCLTGSNKLTTKHKRFFYDKLKEQEVELHAIQGYVLKNYLTNTTGDCILGKCHL